MRLPRAGLAGLAALVSLAPSGGAGADGTASPAPERPVAVLADDLDLDGSRERLTLRADGVLVIEGGGARWGDVSPPQGAPAPREGEATVRMVRVDGRTWVMARWAEGGRRGRGGVEVAFLEGRQVVTAVSQLAGVEGADGEWSTDLRLDERGLLRYQRAPGIDRCDGYDLLFPELYDLAQRRFRSVSLAPPRGEEVAAMAKVPDEAQRPPLGLFRFEAASTRRGDNRRADNLAPPRELDDGRLDTAWYEGASGSGRGAFVTARAPAGPEPLAGMALALAPGNRVESISVVLGRSATTPEGPTLLHVSIPPGAGEGGRFAWVPLGGRTAACVSVALDGVARRGRDDDTGVAEIRLYTGYDAPGGLTRLITRVEQRGPGTDALLPLLGSHPREVAAALPAAAPEGRRLLMRALAASRAREAAAALAWALRSAGSDDRQFIAAALVEAGGAGGLSPGVREPLLLLLQDQSVPAPARQVAIGLLVRDGRGPSAVWGALRAGRLEDSSLGDAAVRALAAAPLEPVLAVLEKDTAGGAAPLPYLDETVRIVGALAGRARATGARELGERAAALLLAAAPQMPTALDDKAWVGSFRWLRAASQARSPRLLPAVERIAAAGDEGLRWAAVEAAALLDGGVGASVVRAALKDSDARVRAAAVRGLLLEELTAEAPGAPAERALRDRWPMVRAAAAERLGASCPGGLAALLERATGDRDTNVAAAALSSLGRCDPPRGGTLALRLLRDVRAARPLRERAVGVAAQVKPPGVAAALSEALQDVLDYPGSDERSVGLASALVRTLGALGDPAGEPGLSRAAGEVLLPALRAQALSALAALCTPGAQQLIKGTLTDEDAAVRRAAAASAARCPR